MVMIQAIVFAPGLFQNGIHQSQILI